MMHKTSLDLPLDTRKKSIEILHMCFVDTLHLSLQAKQAHWNVKGMQFIPLHELFDKAHSVLGDYTDDIAERITALGGTARGTLKTVSHESTLKAYPEDIYKGEDHLKALAANFSITCQVVRNSISPLEKIPDLGSADLLTEISRGLDHHLWLLEAHLQA